MSDPIIERIIKLNPEALTADGYDRSMKGIGYRNGTPVVVYSSDKCIQQLIDDNQWTEEEALEWFSYNTEPAYMGENTPLFEWDHPEWVGE